MSFSHWITVAAVAFLPLAATAQQAQQLNPADASSAVAETSYVSAFKNYITTPEETTTPDQVWRAANEEVARSDPHAGHGSMSGMVSPPAAQQAGAAQADSHAGHAGHGAAMAAPRANTQAATPKVSQSQPDPHAAQRGHGAMPEMKAAPAAQKPSSTQTDPHAGHGAQMTVPKASPPQPDPHAGHSGHNMQGK
ncbi:MAG: hypothetical protein EOO81_00745 [Oxalobacteraceae bacterium]|nr:MAG: hypothetical protein EOO81_00745 [Oxalobacteraceae bacterium]